MKKRKKRTPEQIVETLRDGHVCITASVFVIHNLASSLSNPVARVIDVQYFLVCLTC